MKKFTIFLAYAFILSIFAFSQESNIVLRKSFSNINQLDVELSYENLEIQNSISDQIDLEVSSNNLTSLPSIQESNGILNIQTLKSKTYTKKGDNCKIIVFIPYNFTFDNIYIHTNSSNVSVQNLDALDYIELYSFSGQITCNKLSAVDIKIESNSGKIDIKNLIGQDSKIRNVNGSISVQQLSSSYTYLKTTNGLIRVRNFSTEFFDAESTNGPIELIFSKHVLATSNIKTDNGNIFFQLPEKSDYEIKISSVNGVLKKNTNVVNKESHRFYYEKQGNDGSLIFAETNNGNVSFEN